MRGASALAARAGVSTIVIGLTVVAFGTSAPELSVSIAAALEGKPDVTFGNVIGSNVANIGLLLGITVLIRPVVVHSQVIVRELPMMLVCSAAALALGLDAALDGAEARYQRGDGITLLLLFAIFLFYTASTALRGRREDPLLREAADATPPEKMPGTAIAIALVLAGLAALVGGGRLVVDAAVAIAGFLGMPDRAIAATIVAVGTSLPELVTCIMAARKGLHDLAVGNVVGSNIFNLLFVLGLTTAIHPIAIPGDGWIDLLVMMVFSLMLFTLAITNRRTVTRPEGLLLLAGYAAYAGWQIVR